MKKQEQDAPQFKVLVVDDNKDVADSLATLIGVLGHQATQAYDGASAIEKAAAELPDAVFLDIGMPNVDGYDVARQLAAMRTSPDFRLIAVTGFSDQPHRDQATDAGFTDYLVKPYVSEDVMRILSGRALIAAGQDL
jgi:CheY-like chemotaxis protein